MIRGFTRITSRAALLAAAGLFMSAQAPAQAADMMAGGCCADLEERVAELEATTARKGNRVVSLQVYGQVNKALLVWDDGVDSDVFVVDNDFSGSRLGFTGKGAIKPGWTAGYLIEFDYQDAASDVVTNIFDPDDPDVLDGDEIVAPNGDDPADQIVIRYNNLWIESERLGRITLGQGSTAADGANEVVLGNALRNSDLSYGNSFIIRTGDGGFSEFSLAELASNLDTGRDDLVRYDSPSFYGFILSTSWGDNDYADVALRFKKEWNSIRVAAAVAYVWDDTRDGSLGDFGFGAGLAGVEFEQVGGSISIQHIPSGIYGAFQAAQREFDEIVDPLVLGESEEASFWYAQLGIEKKWLPYGSTTFYGEYGLYEDIVEDGTEAERWGFGVVQKYDSAALEIYAQATFWSFDDDGADGVAEDLEDLSLVMVGSRIKF